MFWLDERNFDLFTFNMILCHSLLISIQSNETDFIGVLFCRVDEAHTYRMENEKVASFCTHLKNINDWLHNEFARIISQNIK